MDTVLVLTFTDIIRIGFLAVIACAVIVAGGLVFAEWFGRKWRKFWRRGEQLD